MNWLTLHSKEHMEQGDPCPTYLMRKHGGDEIFLCNVCGEEYVAKAKEETTDVSP